MLLTSEIYSIGLNSNSKLVINTVQIILIGRSSCSESNLLNDEHYTKIYTDISNSHLTIIEKYSEEHY